MAPDEPKKLKLWEFVPTYNNFQMRHLRRILVKLFRKGVHCTFFSILDHCGFVQMLREAWKFIINPKSLNPGVRSQDSDTHQEKFLTIF